MLCLSNKSKNCCLKYFPSRKYVTSDSTSEKRRLVVLGTGWGAYSVLKNIDRKKYSVTVISPRNYFLFTPLLCSTTVGTLEFRSIVESIHNKSLTGIHYHLATAIALDPVLRTVKCASAVDCGGCKHPPYTITYDKLVMGVGADTNTFGIPGVLEHAYFLKEISDARKIREKLISNFEEAGLPSTTAEEKEALLHVVIVGGGPTGIEFGAEIYDFLREDVSKVFRHVFVKAHVTLIESNQILSSFHQGLQQYAEKKIKSRTRFKLVKASVARVNQHSIELDNGETLKCGLVVWSTGVAPRSFIRDVDLLKNKLGQVLTDGKLRVKSMPDESIFALGDCADIENLPLPPTAQVAEREGRWLAKYLNGNVKTDFRFRDLGTLAYVGDYEALTDFKIRGLGLKGFISWLVWRSAYLTRLGSWKLRMQVPIDWTKTFLFGRDTSKF